MKRSQLYLLCGALCLAILALAGLTVGRVDANCVNPELPDTVTWNPYNPTTGEWPDEVQAEGDGDFEAEERLSWCYTNAPTHGAFEWLEDEPDSYNVTGVSYSPAYFFPSSSAGSVDVLWTGTLPETTEDGYLTTLGWCWPPYDDETRRVDVLKP